MRRIISTYATIVAAVSIVSLPSIFAEGEWTLHVEAGGQNRQMTPVSVVVPYSWKNSQRVLMRAEGTAKKTAELGQVSPHGDGKGLLTWVIEDLAAGTSRTYSAKVAKVTSANYAWSDSSAEKIKSLDLKIGGQPVLRYMHTPFDKADIELTKKPFHMVYSPDGKRFLTKPHGGLFPHHRGIYFGYNRCRIGDKGSKNNADIWHARDGEHTIHVDTLEKIEGPVAGGHVLKIHWNDRQGKTFAEETRRLVVYSQAGGQRLIEFDTTLRATDEPVDLKGDPPRAPSCRTPAAQCGPDHRVRVGRVPPYPVRVR
ncbi:MAG: DUF6807 family protein, partial [Planctomycetota bacterium]